MHTLLVNLLPLAFAPWRLALAGVVLLAALGLPAACATPVTQFGWSGVSVMTPRFEPERGVFVAADGAELGLTVWPAVGTAEPSHVVIALHGMSDYANAFHMAGPYWAARGVTTYAYDHRGFGRSPNKGLWPDEDLLRTDLRTAVAVARARHPNAVITVVGISMGAAIAMTAFASDDPPAADRLILSGPALRGWGAINPLYRAGLWAAAHTNPGWLVVPPAGLVKIEPSDNIEMLQRTWSDPHMTYRTRIDQVYGLVDLMEHAHRVAPRLPATVPTLFSYGAKDIVVPENGVRRTAGRLPPHVRTVYYRNGYHMLERDLQASTVHADYLAFMLDPSAPLPSGEPALPFLDSGSP